MVLFLRRQSNIIDIKLYTTRQQCCRAVSTAATKTPKKKKKPNYDVYIQRRIC